LPQLPYTLKVSYRNLGYTTSVVTDVRRRCFRGGHSIYLGRIRSADSLGNCYSLKYARREIYGCILSICDISRTIYIYIFFFFRLLENRCTSLAWYNKYDKIFNFVLQCQILKIHQLESRLSKINRFLLCFSLREIIKYNRIYIFSKFFRMESHSKEWKLSQSWKKNSSIFNLQKWNFTFQSEIHFKHFRKYK